MWNQILPVTYTGVSAKVAHENQKSWNTKPVRGLERFDPFHLMHYEQSQSAPTKCPGDWHFGRTYGRATTTFFNEFLIADFSQDVEENRGRRITKWHFFKDLNNDLTPKIICGIEKRVRNWFVVKNSYAYSG